MPEPSYKIRSDILYQKQSGAKNSSENNNSIDNPDFHVIIIKIYI